MINFLLQFMLWKIMNILFVNLFLKTDVDWMCLQHLFNVLVKQGEHFPICLVEFRTTLLLISLVCPITFFRFLLRRNERIGFSVNFPTIVFLTISVSQQVSIILLMSGVCLLYVVMKGILCCFSFSLYTRVSSLCIPFTSVIYILINGIV